MFHTRYTLRGVSYLLHRMGFSPQVPGDRAVERDEDAVTTLCLPKNSSVQVTEDPQGP